MSKPASSALIRKLAIDWAKVSMSYSFEPPREVKSIAAAEKMARLAHASEVLKRPVSTFNDLSMAESFEAARRLQGGHGRRV
jgi:hypothetical protein